MNANIVQIATDLKQLAAQRRLAGDHNCTELDIVAYAIRTHRIWILLGEAEREYIAGFVEQGGHPIKHLSDRAAHWADVALAAYRQVTDNGNYVKDYACKVCIGEDEAAKLPEHMKDFTCWYHKAEALLPKEPNG